MYTSLYDHRQNVFELQYFLRRLYLLGFAIPLINPDGIFGPETAQAVTDIQNQFGLPPTGEADYVTWLTIREGKLPLTEPA